MSQDPLKYSIHESSTIADTLKAIERSSTGICLIVDERSRFLNLATDGDIRRALLGGATLESKIAGIDLGKPISARVSDPPSAVKEKFSTLIRHLPILDSDDRVVEVLFFDKRSEIKIARPALEGNELRYVSRAVSSGWISSKGGYISEFEQRFAEFCGTEYAISVSNGTVALELALRCAHIGSGAEVIIPTLTFAATANAVLHVGAQPVFVDSTLDTWCLDPIQVERNINERTRAVIAVHLYGQPAEMEHLRKICDHNHLLLIEDAAEAHGARYFGEPVGSLGDIACFSFYANKIVTTGEGGMLVTDNQEFANHARLLANHGMSEKRKYWHEIVGFNFRMSNLQAAVGVAQMERVTELVEAKKSIAARYFSELSSIPGLKCAPIVDGTESVYWCFGIILDEKQQVTPKSVIDQAREEGIEFNPFFPPLHLMPPYPGERGEHPISEVLSDYGLLLPAHSRLTEEEQERVIAFLKKVLL
jgi:perosamine synthetase